MRTCVARATLLVVTRGVCSVWAHGCPTKHLASQNFGHGFECPWVDQLWRKNELELVRSHWHAKKLATIQTRTNVLIIAKKLIRYTLATNQTYPNLLAIICWSRRMEIGIRIFKWISHIDILFRDKIVRAFGGIGNVWLRLWKHYKIGHQIRWMLHYFQILCCIVLTK
jgi:hypothetical protein